MQSKRHTIAHALFDLNQNLFETQRAVHHATYAFTQFDVTNTLGELVTAIGALDQAREQASLILESTRALRPLQPAPSLDPVLTILQQARTALNTATRFSVPACETDSYAIANQIDALLHQLGGDQ